MTATAPHIYVESDIADGLTLVEWRRSHRATAPRRFPRRPVRRLVRRLTH